MDPAMERIDETREPRLERIALPSLLGADPVRELRDDHRAGVAVVPLVAEPGDHLGVPLALGGLAEDVGIEQPAHSLARNDSRRRGGRSSMGTGHASSTSSQSAPRAI